MQIGEWVLVKGCGRNLKFQLIAYTRSRKGMKIAILKNYDDTNYELRFVPVEHLEAF